MTRLIQLFSIVFLALPMVCIGGEDSELSDQSSQHRRNVELGVNDTLSIHFNNDFRKARFFLVHSTGEGDIVGGVLPVEMGPFLRRTAHNAMEILEKVDALETQLKRFPRFTDETINPKLAVARELAQGIVEFLKVIQMADTRVWINGQPLPQHIRSLGIPYLVTYRKLAEPMVQPKVMGIRHAMLAVIEDRLVKMAFWDEISTQLERFAPGTFSGNNAQKITALSRIMGMAIDLKYSGLFEEGLGCDFLVSVETK